MPHNKAKPLIDLDKTIDLKKQSRWFVERFPPDDLLSKTLPREVEQKLDLTVNQSIKQQQEMEANDTLSFDEFLNDYMTS